MLVEGNGTETSGQQSQQGEFPYTKFRPGSLMGFVYDLFPRLNLENHAWFRNIVMGGRRLNDRISATLVGLEASADARLERVEERWRAKFEVQDGEILGAQLRRLRPQ